MTAAPEAPAVSPTKDVEGAILDAFARDWAVILHDDSVTPIEIPIHALIEVIGLSQERAIRTTLQVQAQGRGIVATAPLERAEHYATSIQHFDPQYPLTVTLEQFA